jgi:hypothetical protein
VIGGPLGGGFLPPRIEGLAGAGWAVVAFGFLERVLGTVLVAQRVCLFGLCIVRQKTFDGADDAGSRCTIIRTTDSGECIVRCARGFNKALRVSFGSFGGAIGDDALLQRVLDIEGDGAGEVFILRLVRVDDVQRVGDQLGSVLGHRQNDGVALGNDLVLRCLVRVL